MGIYVINCSNCKTPFSWFSGNVADQLCANCHPNRTTVEKSDGGYMSVDREEAIKNNFERIQNLTLPGQQSKATKSPREITVYLDGVDFQHEVGEACDGNKIYPNMEDVKENEACWDSCGIVKCKLVFEEWVLPQDITKGATTYYTEEKLKTAPTEHFKSRLESSQRMLKFYNRMVKNYEAKIEKLTKTIKERE